MDASTRIGGSKIPHMVWKEVAHLERRSRGMERMWLFHEDIELLQSLREQVERVCRGDSRKCMPIEISGRTAKAVKLRISTLRQQLKSDVLVLDAAYLRDQTIYKNAAKTATLADAVAAVAAAKMKKAAAAREASVGCAQRAGKVAPLPWRRSAPGAQSVRLSYDTPTSLEYTHGPVPVGALINDALRTAIIPPAWRLQIGTFDERIGTDLPAFAIEDVRRSTTVADIISAATRWIALQPSARAPAGVRFVLALVEPASVSGRSVDIAWLRGKATAEEADLFHRAPFLGLTLAPAHDTSVSDIWARHNDAAQPAYNTRPTAPEHIGMLNDLLGLDGERDPDSNLQPALSEANRAALAAHLKVIAKTPTRVCFQCGMLNYPKSGDTIVVNNVTEQSDCRAFRVFEHYISALEEHMGEDEPPFLCEPVEGSVGCRVFACSFCKKLCEFKMNGEVTYVQCQPNELDLFDGHAQDGTYQSIGIGDAQPAELAALTISDRLALSVLKMADATFKAYSGPGYTHMHGGGLLVPNDYRGLASLLIEHERGVLAPDDSNGRLLAALRLLKLTNPIVRRTLTCFERELRGEEFPAAAGGISALPSLPQNGACFQERRAGMSGVPPPVLATHVGGLSGASGVTLVPPRFIGAAVSVLELDAAATEDRNVLGQQSVGTRVMRATSVTVAQPVLSVTAEVSPDNAVHTVLYPYGQGGFYAKGDDTNLTRDHHRKKTLLSVAEPNHAAEEV